MDEDDFTEGEIFNTFEEFQTKLQKFETKLGLKFSTKSSHMLPANCQHLKYSEVLYRCPRAGIFKSKGEGIREIKSKKTDCQACIKIKADKGRTYIVVDEFKPSHNHALPQGEDLEKFHSERTSKKAEDQPGNESPSVDARRKILKTIVNDLVHVVLTSSTDVIFDERLEAMRMLLKQFNSPSDAHGRKDGSRSEHEDSALIPSEFLTVKMGNNEAEENCSAQSSTHDTEKSITDDKKAESLSAVAKQVVESEGTNSEPTSADADRESAVALATSKNESENDSHSDESEKPNGDTISADPVASGSVPQDLSTIVMPKKRGKGRPKGAVLTAIGLPKKVHVPRMFSTKSDVEKARDILSWLVEQTVVDQAINGEYRLRETDLQLKSLRDSFLDNSVDLNVIKSHFESKAFALLKKTVNIKKKEKVFTCQSCQKGINDKSVLCSSCLLWGHYGCVGLKRAPRASPWFCPQCRKK